MKTIFKYPISVYDSQTIEMPIGAKILTVQTQHGEPCIWALVDASETELQPRILRTVGTGHGMPNTELVYIATYQMLSGQFVGHVFEECIRPKFSERLDEARKKIKERKK